MKSAFERLEFEIFDPFAAPLAAASLDSFETLMRAPVGDLISSERGREVRRIAVEGTSLPICFYLKRNSEPIPASWFFKKIARGRWQMGRSYYELRALNLLLTEGFLAMKPVAWGQRSVWGVPRESFLLVEEVPGPLAEALWQSGGPSFRRRLMRDAGRLVGRLNRAGFFSWFRLKDLICTDVPEDPRRTIVLVQIDREFSRDRLERFSADRCSECLARSYSRLVDAEPEPSLREVVDFCRAYLGEISDCMPVSVRDLLAAVDARVRALSGQSGPFAGTVERSQLLRGGKRQNPDNVV